MFYFSCELKALHIIFHTANPKNVIYVHLVFMTSLIELAGFY